jgi:hypothetical protein
MPHPIVTNNSSLAADEFTVLANEIASHSGLNDVLTWAATKPREQVHSQFVAEVVTQDEFTHDVIVPYKDIFLIYDTT